MKNCKVIAITKQKCGVGKMTTTVNLGVGLAEAARAFAKEHGVTVDEGKRDMQAAIDHAYKNTPNDGITGLGKIVLRKKVRQNS